MTGQETFCSFFWKEMVLRSYLSPSSSRRIEIFRPFGVALERPVRVIAGEEREGNIRTPSIR